MTTVRNIQTNMENHFQALEQTVGFKRMLETEADRTPKAAY